MNEQEAYDILKSLGNYLKTEVKFTSGKIETIKHEGFNSRPTLSDGHKVTVTINNTAPECDYPTIVFTGVGLIVQFPKAHRTIIRMRNEDNLKIDLSNAPQDDPNLKGLAESIDGVAMPFIKSDSRNPQGHILFPGKSIKYEMDILASECPNINDLKLRIEGVVSRHHLFHISNDVKVS